MARTSNELSKSNNGSYRPLTERYSWRPSALPVMAALKSMSRPGIFRGLVNTDRSKYKERQIVCIGNEAIAEAMLSRRLLTRWRRNGNAKLHRAWSCPAHADVIGHRPAALSSGSTLWLHLQAGGYTVNESPLGSFESKRWDFIGQREIDYRCVRRVPRLFDRCHMHL